MESRYPGPHLVFFQEKFLSLLSTECLHYNLTLSHFLWCLYYSDYKKQHLLICQHPVVRHFSGQIKYLVQNFCTYCVMLFVTSLSSFHSNLFMNFLLSDGLFLKINLGLSGQSLRRQTFLRWCHCVMIHMKIILSFQ